MAQVPMVEYLVLGDEPHLVAHQCAGCGARFFDRRCACARCGGLEFQMVPVDAEGSLSAFTIVHQSAPGVEVPFVAGIVDCGGTSVRGNVINVEPDTEHVRLGMRLRLTTKSLGVDQEGAEAVGFGFEPVD